MHERTNPGPPPERPPFLDVAGSGGLSVAGEAAAAHGSAASALADPRALQILTTEHWSLLATRSLSYNEAFTRAGMFLTALSASMVAIAFVAQADRTGSAVPIFTLVLLAFDLFVGLTTYLRLIETTREDLRCVQGMNRIRHAYLEMTPGLAPYFVTGDRDDLAGVLMTYEGPSAADMTMRGMPFAGFVHGFSTNTGMVGVVVSLVAASLAGVAVAQVTTSLVVIVLIGAVVFVVLTALLAQLSIRSLATFGTSATAIFPSDTPGSVAGGQAPEG